MLYVLLWTLSLIVVGWFISTHYTRKIVALTKESKKELLNAAQEWEKQLEAKEKLLADAVHEIRTPLSVMKSRLEGMLEGTVKPEQEQLVPLIDEVNRLSRLVHELRQLSLAEAGKLKLNYEWVSLYERIQHIWELFVPDMEMKQLDKEINLHSLVHLKVYCDPQKMDQVLINLIGNAVNYAQRGGRVKVMATDDQYQATISVYNSGEGISLEHLPYVFQRFYRVDRSRQRASGGMGLGLAIAKHYVEAHEGHISVDSKPDEGTVFQFSIPMFPPS